MPTLSNPFCIEEHWTNKRESAHKKYVPFFYMFDIGSQLDIIHACIHSFLNHDIDNYDNTIIIKAYMNMRRISRAYTILSPMDILLKNFAAYMQ